MNYGIPGIPGFESDKTLVVDETGKTKPLDPRDAQTKPLVLPPSAPTPAPKPTGN